LIDALASKDLTDTVLSHLEDDLEAAGLSTDAKAVTVDTTTMSIVVKSLEKALVELAMEELYDAIQQKLFEVRSQGRRG